MSIKYNGLIMQKKLAVRTVSVCSIEAMRFRLFANKKSLEGSHTVFQKLTYLLSGIAQLYGIRHKDIEGDF